jgi:septal ring-binding cell division protein DamX
MASGGRRTAGERVLESKHVIGLFLLMLLFSGVFFSLGYVMGRNQYDGQVRAAGSWAGRPETDVQPKPVVPAKKNPQVVEPPAASAESDPATATPPEWDFYKNSQPPKNQPHLEPAAKTADAPATSRPVNAKTTVQPVSAPVKSTKPVAPPQAAPAGAFVLQVAALQKQDDALAVASSLQKKHYLCYVLPPQKDKYYRVQVGPFKDRKAADTAKQGLENEGFKAFYVKH